jgi:hypothetical protein
MCQVLKHLKAQLSLLWFSGRLQATTHFINGNPFKGTFKRNYEGDYHCTEEEVKEMLRDSNDAGNDGFLLEGFTMEDIDPETLKAYRMSLKQRIRTMFGMLMKTNGFWKTLVVIRLTGIQKRRINHGRLADVWQRLPVRERFDNIRMDYLDKTNLLPGMRWSDRVTYDGGGRKPV